MRWVWKVFCDSYSNHVLVVFLEVFHAFLGFIVFVVRILLVVGYSSVAWLHLGSRFCSKKQITYVSSCSFFAVMFSSSPRVS